MRPKGAASGSDRAPGSLTRLHLPYPAAQLTGRGQCRGTEVVQAQAKRTKTCEETKASSVGRLDPGDLCENAHLAVWQQGMCGS